jgi:small subunit ribosomal protein S5
MTDEQTVQTTETPIEPVVRYTKRCCRMPAKEASREEAPQGRRDRGARGRGTRASAKEESVRRKEFEQTTIEVRRVARVMAGGRRFSFSVAVVIGDKKGRVGVGLGKAGDTALAIDKAVRDARRHLITIPLTKEGSIAHDVSCKYASSTVTIVPSVGRGVVAGSAMRTVLEYAGVQGCRRKDLEPHKEQAHYCSRDRASA